MHPALEVACRWGRTPHDSEETTKQRGVVILVSLLGMIPTLLHATMLYSLGWRIAATIETGVAAALFLNVAAVGIHRRVGVLLRGAMVIVLLGPTFVGLATADPVQSAVHATWSMLGPLSGALYLSRREVLVWLIVDIALVLAVSLLPPLASDGDLVMTPQQLRLVLAWNIVLVTMFVTLMVVYLVQLRRDAMDALSVEHERSEQLLLNVLPPSIAQRLKAQPGTIADRFDEATILFADIVGFTTYSATVTPERLVAMLNELFSEFDQLADKHGLEKIKTIGDAYMVVGGIPERRADHAVAVAEMALDMIGVLRRRSQETGQVLDVRIGINTGPVVAGVIGRKKFIYDLWGDAVNTASRMESHGISGSIHVASSTHALLKGRYELEPRGALHIKGKGEMETYLLRGRLGVQSAVLQAQASVPSASADKLN